MTMKRAYKEAPAADHNESLVAIQHKVLANVSLVDEALVKCQENCPCELYTYQQPDKRFKINTFRDEHTCTTSWQNRRVHASYLTKKYITKFEFDPKMSLNSFIGTVKEDCMYEISKHRLHRTKAKCAEVFNGIVVEQYKILWDYGEELKRTNPSSTMKIEGQCHTYKRLYMFRGL